MAYKPRKCLRCGKPLWHSPCHEVKAGMIYKAKGTGPRGRRAGTMYWLILTVNEDVVHMAGLNKDGGIVSTTSYGIHTLHDRTLVGNAPGTLDFKEYLQGLKL